MLRQANGLCATLTDFKRTSSAECICVLLFCFFYSFHHSSKFTLKKKLYINNIYVNFSALLSRLLSLSCIVVLCFDFFSSFHTYAVHRCISATFSHFRSFYFVIRSLVSTNVFDLYIHFYCVHLIHSFLIQRTSDSRSFSSEKLPKKNNSEPLNETN